MTPGFGGNFGAVNFGGPPVGGSVGTFADPASIAGLQLWLKADAGTYQDPGGTTPASADGDAVRLWKDRSGNGNDMPADVGTPTLSAPGPRTLPVVHCSAASFRRATLAAGLTGPFTYVFVCRKTDASTWRYLFDSYSGDRAAVLFDPSVGSGGAQGLGMYVTPGDGSVHALDGTWHPPTPYFAGLAVFQGSSSQYWRDGFPVRTLDPGGTPASPAGFCINNALAGFDDMPVADYAEVLVYQGDITADPLLPELFDYLSRRWGTRTASAVAAPGGLKDYFPSAELLDDADLVASFRRGTDQLSADGAVHLARSSDGGQTWTDGLVHSDDTYNCLCDLGLKQLASGALILPFWTADTGGNPIAAYTLASSDRGASWSSPRSVATPAGYAGLHLYGRILEPTPGGTLLMPGYATNSTSGKTDSLLLQSTDGGTTWTLKSVIAAGDATPKNFNEASVLALTRSSYLAFVRDDNLASGIWKVASSDGGATWGTPGLFDPSGDGGSPFVSPDLVKLAGGPIQLSVGQRFGSPAVGIRQFTSADSGATWPTDEYLDQAPGSGDFGYPSTVGRADGTTVTLFYDAGQDVVASLVVPGPPSFLAAWLGAAQTLGIGIY